MGLVDERKIDGGMLELALHEDSINGGNGTPRESATYAADLVAATHVATLDPITGLAGKGGTAPLAATQPLA